MLNTVLSALFDIFVSKICGFVVKLLGKILFRIIPKKWRTKRSEKTLNNIKHNVEDIEKTLSHDGNDFDKKTVVIKQPPSEINVCIIEKKIRDIKEYKDVIKSVLKDTYIEGTFDKIKDEILDYFDDEVYLFKIRKLNEIVVEYLRRCNNQIESTVFSFKDSIQSQFRDIEPILDACVQRQNIMLNNYFDTITKSAAQEGFKNESSISAEQTAEYFQGLKKFEDL